MPSKSPAQKRLMDAVEHGWKMPGGKGPSRAVAHKFVEADKRASSSPSSRKAARKKKLSKWAKGGK